MSYRAKDLVFDMCMSKWLGCYVSTTNRSLCLVLSHVITLTSFFVIIKDYVGETVYSAAPGLFCHVWTSI